MKPRCPGFRTPAARFRGRVGDIVGEGRSCSPQKKAGGGHWPPKNGDASCAAGVLGVRAGVLGVLGVAPPTARCRGVTAACKRGCDCLEAWPRNLSMTAITVQGCLPRDKGLGEQQRWGRAGAA